MSNENAQEQQAPQKKEVSISAILADLKSGKSRKEIRTEHGWTATQATAIFEHPKLKGIRVKPSMDPSIVLVDDAPDAPVYSAPIKKAKVASASTEVGTATEASAPVTAPVTAPVVEAAAENSAAATTNADTDNAGGW